MANTTIAPDVSEHLHADTDVTTKRVDGFAAASREVQARVLGTLRERAAEENLELPIMGVVLAVILTIVGFAFVPEVMPGPMWAKVIALAFVAVILGLGLVVVVGWGPIRDHRRRQVATVWLGAYDDELNRWRAMEGREGRRWRRTH